MTAKYTQEQVSIMLLDMDRQQREIEHLRLRINELSRHPVFGCFNIHGAEQAWNELPQDSYTLFTLDLNQLHALNHKYGMSRADKMIKAFLDQLRGSDIVAALGGDEFIIVVKTAEADAAAKRIADVLYTCGLHAMIFRLDAITDLRKSIRYALDVIMRHKSWRDHNFIFTSLKRLMPYRVRPSEFIE